MLFSSMLFLWTFLPITLIGFVLLRRTKLGDVFLLLMSLVFYAWGEPVYVLLMIFSILFNWGIGMLAAPGKQHRKAVLILALLINLGSLITFKYLGLLINTFNILPLSLKFSDPQIALPIGISFFTFQAVSYIIDVYKGDVAPQKNVMKLALYISFFPQLIAGPIVRYSDINKQLEHRECTLTGFAEGCRRFIYGLAKKVLIANTLAGAADRIFAVPAQEITGAMAWAAALLYTFQIYYDFSGYSDMAIGLGKMFGFTFLENFNYPYTSRSVREFWRRWHISLSTWFREYVYIPLGGNRKGNSRTLMNLLIVFLCTGFWHGAAWSFLLWGIYHGVFSVLERGRFGKIIAKAPSPVQWLYSMLTVIFGWVLFRLESVHGWLLYIRKMLFLMRPSIPAYRLAEFVDLKTAMMFCVALLGMGFIQRTLGNRLPGQKWKGSLPEAVWLLMLLVLCVISLAGNTYNPFIYFRF